MSDKIPAGSTGGISMEDGDIKLIILDLYRKAYLQMEGFTTVAPTLIALVNSFSELDPRFAETYARHLESAKRQQNSEGSSRMLSLLAEKIAELEKMWGVPSKR
jgi:hypothetical protein